jgi:CBS domain-containing membrane protein
MEPEPGGGRVWIRRFLPQPLPTSYLERLRASLGALLGIALTGLVGTFCFGPVNGLPLLVAPMGASAVLLFGVPASPLAQPWSIIGGNFVAALVGVTAARWIASPLAAAAIAVGCAFAIMSLLRCIHPPSGAVALTAVLGGSHILSLGYGFVLVPIGIDSLALVVTALLYNNLTGRSYPHHAHASAHPHPAAVQLSLGLEDLDAVLEDYGEALDISRDDLDALFQELLGRAQQRTETAT